MSTRVESNQTSASKANDFLKNLPLKQNDGSSQPFKNELAKARQANEKPKAHAKPDDEHAKKTTSRSSKSSESKAKKPVKPGADDDQPQDEVETEKQAKPPQPNEDAEAQSTDEADAEHPVEPQKAKTDETDAKPPTTPIALTAGATQTIQVKNAVRQPQAKKDAQDPRPAQVRAIDANASDKNQQSTTKKTDTKANEGKPSAGQIDSSKVDDSATSDESAHASDDEPAKPEAVASDDDPVAKTSANGSAKAPAAPQAVAIQPVQQQDQQSSSYQQTGDADQPQQLSDAMEMLDSISEATAAPPTEAGAHTKATPTAIDGPELAMMAPKMPDATTIAKPAAPAPPVPPEMQFAATNHDKMITAMRSELLPGGGTMHIRLDPPELGALQVKVTMQDGVMTAAFETSNDDATKLLSHSLNQLKHALESQGVSVDKLHVQQSPRSESSSNQKDENGNPSSQSENHRSAQQEQQRKEMIRKMWRRLGVGYDPLDMVA